MRASGRDRRTSAGDVTVRTHRDFRMLLGRVQPGDLVVIDRRDLDGASARALAERRPAAVLNASEFVSGRFANLGPSVLDAAGVLLLEGAPEQVGRLKDGSGLRLDGTRLYDGDQVVVEARQLTTEDIRERMDRARTGMASQLDTFAHTASEFLRREEGVLLHGTGLPALRTDLSDRPVVVVGPHATERQVRRLRTFLREQRPVVVGVDGGAELLTRGRRRLDVLVLGRDAAPSDKALRRAREVVLHGTGDGARRQVAKLNVPTHEVTTSASSTDLGLLIAHAAGARLVVPVGDPSTLEELIDRERSDQASTVLTRMRLGTTVVESDAVPLLYTGRVRLWQVLLLLLAALAVLAVTIAATPVGHDWWHDLSRHLPDRIGGDEGSGR
jgi:uncharacterized membrane-anchored protein